MKGVTASAEAYSENYITATGMMDHFAAMETDFCITVQVAHLNNREELGTLLEKILGALDAGPPRVPPGPNSGYIGVTFQAGSDELHLWFIVAYRESARALVLHGAALLDKLQNP